MKKIISFILIFLPFFIQLPLRRMMGQHIGKGSKIKFGSLILSTSVNIGSEVKIGPFCFIKAEQLFIDDHSSIKSFSIISTRIVKLKKYVHIAPLSIINSEFTENSKIEIGDHSRIFPYCWLDTGEGIFIGNNVGVGGHTLIFTHGIWPDYIDGGPVSFGPVTLKDNIWLPWRIFILPNVEIGENSIIGANSLVNKSFPKNVLIGGSPAKIIKENISTVISAEEKIRRVREIFKGFSEYLEFKLKVKPLMEDDQMIFDNFKIVLDDDAKVKNGDLLLLFNNELSEENLEKLYQNKISVLSHKDKTIRLTDNNKIFILLISYLRKYGIRLYVNKG